MTRTTILDAEAPKAADQIVGQPGAPVLFGGLELSTSVAQSTMADHISAGPSNSVVENLRQRLDRTRSRCPEAMWSWCDYLRRGAPIGG